MSTKAELKLIGRMKPVQICLDCKAEGKVTVRETVMQMVDHIIKDHDVPATPKA